MARGCYVGVSSKARKVKKIYIGVDGVARKVKRAYVGDANGVARLWWNGGVLTYYGTATALSAKRWYLSGGSVGNYAVFAGGYYNDSNVVDAYDQNLTRTIASTLSEAKHHIPTASIGNYIIFAGGHTSDGNTAVAKKKVDAYNTSLTKTTKTDLANSIDGGVSGVTIGNYAFLASGTVAVYYNSSLTRYNGTALSSNRLGVAAATVGNYALYAGGGAMQYGGWYQGEKTVDAYNTSLTRSSAPDLQAARAEMARATICDTYCIFAGGNISSNSYGYVDVYNTSLTKTTVTQLTSSRIGLAGGGIGDYAVFAGGGSSSSSPVDTVEAYDLNLTKTSVTSLSAARIYLAAANINDVYLLFAGGRTSSSSSSASTIVDVYMV